MEPNDALAPSDPLAAQLGWVRDLARALVGNASDADDVAQEVWLKASSNPAARDRAWLTVVTRRVVQGLRRSEVRRQRRETAVSRPETDPHEDVVERGESCRRVLEAVMALEEPYRSTVLRRYVDGLSVADIAAREGVTEVAVRKRLSRALARLRSRLDEEFEGGRSMWMAALLRVGNSESSGAATALGLGTVGVVLLMKKALVVAALVILICAALFTTTTGRGWIGLDGSPAETAEVARVDPPLDPTDAGLEPPATAPSNREIVDAPPTPARVIVVEGRVVNLPWPDESAPRVPAAGVEVTLRLPFLGSAPMPSTQTTTDADGRFRIELQDPGVAATHANLGVEGDENYRPKGANILLDGSSQTFERDLERAAHGELAGIVVDEDSRPVADIVVRLEQASGWSWGNADVSQPAVPPAPETTTDGNGRFVFRNVHSPKDFNSGSPSLVVRSAGLQMLPTTPPAIRPRGGWEEARIRLLPSGGRLEVRVLDALGAPQAGVRVAVGLSHGEPGAGWEPWGQAAERPGFQDQTDADGRVAFTDLYVEKRLALDVQSDLGRWPCERASDGKIDLGHLAHGAGIVIQPAKTLALDIVLPATSRLLGRVIDPAGDAVVGAHVLLAVRGEEVQPQSRLVVQSGEDGRFEAVLARPDRALVIDLSAYTGPGSDWAWVETLPVIPDRMVGRRVVEFDPRKDAEAYFELVVQSALTISGVARNADGTPCQGRVAAIAANVPEGYFMRGGIPLDPEGRFVIGGLLAGEYTLDVRPKANYVFTDCLLSQRFTGIAAGRSDVELELGEDRAVDVEIEVAAADGQPTDLTVVLGMFNPYAERDIDGHVPDARAKYSGLSGWPRGATLNFGGQSGGVGPDGITGFLHVRGEVPLHRLKPMNEGWYWIGLDAREASGARYHACGTGLVYLAPGAYRFHFDLVRQTSIEGVIASPDPERDVALMLVTPDGRSVQVQRTDRYLDDVVSIGAGGRFRIEGVPVGEFRLRAGNELELRRGQFGADFALHVRPTENSPLELSLP